MTKKKTKKKQNPKVFLFSVLWNLAWACWCLGLGWGWAAAAWDWPRPFDLALKLKGP